MVVLLTIASNRFFEGNFSRNVKYGPPLLRVLYRANGFLKLVLIFFNFMNFLSTVTQEG